MMARVSFVFAGDVIMSSLLELGEVTPALLVVLVVLAAAALLVVFVVVLEAARPEHELHSRRRVARRAPYDHIP